MCSPAHLVGFVLNLLEIGADDNPAPPNIWLGFLRSGTPSAGLVSTTSSSSVPPTVPEVRVILPPLGLANRQIMHEMQDLLRKRSVMGILPHITLCVTNRFPADLRVVVKHLNKRLDRYIPSTHPPPVKRHVTLSFHLNNDFMQCSEHELQHLCSMQALTSGKFKCLSVKVTWPSNFRVRDCKRYLNRYSRQFGNRSPRKAPQQWKVFVEAFDAKTRARIPDQHPPLKERAKDLLRREAAQTPGTQREQPLSPYQFALP